MTAVTTYSTLYRFTVNEYKTIIKNIFINLKNYFLTGSDITCTDRLEMQASVEESRLIRWLSVTILLIFDRIGTSVLQLPVRES